MYKLGDVELLTEDMEEYVTDARGNYENLRRPCACLPHSCDYWIIGGPKEIKTMISDLQTILLQLERN